jgi:hypothetical protein
MAATRSSFDPNRRCGIGAAISLPTGNFCNPAQTGRHFALDSKDLRGNSHGPEQGMGRGRAGIAAGVAGKRHEVAAPDRHTASPPPSAQHDRRLRRFSRRSHCGWWRERCITGVAIGTTRWLRFAALTLACRIKTRAVAIRLQGELRQFPSGPDFVERDAREGDVFGSTGLTWKRRDGLPKPCFILRLSQSI